MKKRDLPLLLAWSLAACSSSPQHHANVDAAASPAHGSDADGSADATQDASLPLTSDAGAPPTQGDASPDALDGGTAHDAGPRARDASQATHPDADINTEKDAAVLPVIDIDPSLPDAPWPDVSDANLPDDDADPKSVFWTFTREGKTIRLVGFDVAAGTLVPNPVTLPFSTDYIREAETWGVGIYRFDAPPYCYRPSLMMA